MATTEEELAQLKQAYAADMQIIGNFIREQSARTPQRAASDPAATPDEEDISTMTPARIRQIAAEAVQQTVTPIAQGYQVNQFEHNRAVAKLRIPEFNEYEKEINDVVAQALRVNPAAATDPALFDSAMQVVRIRHLDEIADKRAKEKLKAKLAELGVEEEEEEPAVEPTSSPAPTEPSSTPPSAQRVAAQAPTAPAGGVATRPSILKRPRAKLDEEQTYVAQRLGIAPDQFDEYSHSGYTRDVLGLRDKDGRYRDRV